MEKEILDSNQKVPNAIRKHIAIIGKTNAGKSSLINAICNQDISIVSDIPGTTTDAVSKAMELFGVGAVTFIDTAGYNDDSLLGSERIKRTDKAIAKSDCIILIVDPFDEKYNQEILQNLNKYNIPIVKVINKMDLLSDYDIDDQEIIMLSAKNKTNIDKLLNKLSTLLKEDDIYITGNLVKENDIIVLVMPQNIQAPKGRLILPQVQVIRELLDRKCNVLCTTTENLKNSIDNINHIDLVITDSQEFKKVNNIIPKTIPLTSFSILFSAYKGDINYFMASANVLDNLKNSSNILIAEGCTHAPKEEDIGTIKIPNMLRKKYPDINIYFNRGNDFDIEDSKYDLIIHCGACMLNNAQVKNRIRLCKEKNIPITNYGIFLAKMNDILDRVVY